MKHIRTRLVSLILAAAICFSCAATAVFAAEPQEKFDLAGVNMTLGNELRLNIAAKNTDLQEGYVAKITHGDLVTETTFSKYNASVSTVSYGVSAKQMADTLTVEVFDANGNAVSNVYEVSVRSYAMRMLTNGTSTQKMKTLLVDMLNYGAEAQEYFSYNQEDPANALLTDAHRAMATGTVSCTNKQIKGENVFGTNLTLGDQILMNAGFNNVTEGMYATVSFTDYRGEKKDIYVPFEEFRHHSGNRYLVAVDDIVLADATSLVTVTVYNADDTVHGSVVDSVESYVARVGSSGLNDAIMKFARSAYLYLADREGLDVGNLFTANAQLDESGQITVTVILEKAAQLSGLDVRLGYDGSKLDWTSYGPEMDLSLDPMVTLDEDAYEFRTLMLNVENAQIDQIMTATFEAKEGATGLASFTVKPVTVLTANADGSFRAATSSGSTVSVEIGHIWNDGVESGDTITYTCTVCGETRTEEISFHNWNAGELIKAPTDTEAGEVLYTCLDADCGETKTETVAAGTKIYTRADLEEAVEELSWDYLLKMDKIQYDSMELDAMGKYYGGKFLVTEGAAPEYGTSHTEINSVCSDYVWKVYEEALHHNLLGGKSSLEAVTADMWYNAENQVYTSDEEDIDSTLVRWQTLAFTDLEKQYGVPDSPHFVETKEEVFEYFFNWETMLRPGDVLVDKGHALIYAGNGKVLHCNGTKYQPSDNTLNHEGSGSVNGVSPLSCTDTSWLNTRANSGRLIVWRPTEFLVAKDTDGDLGNDIVRDPNFTMPADTLSRLAYPGMEIDRTVDITPFGTASVGQVLTYSVKISNMSSNSKYMAAKQVSDSTYTGVTYENLIVTETIPAGTTYVEGSATEDGVYDEETNTITWNLTIKPGKSVTPAYSVEATGEIGDMIVNDGGFVANIPSNTISNRIGGVKLNEFAENALLDLADSDTADWDDGTDLAFAEKIYEQAETALTLPTVSEIVENLFTWTSTLGEIRSTRYSDKDPVDVFMLREDADMGMIIPTYYGGYRFFTGSDAIGSTISEFRLSYLEPGDIIVNVDTDAGAVVSAQVAVFAGNDTLLISNTDGTYAILKGTTAKLQLWKSFLASNDLFFALRPSQTADLKAAHTWDEGTVTTEPTCGSEGEMTYTCLDEGCGATKTKVLEKTTEHNWSDEATDTENGTHVLTCSDCGSTKTELHIWDDGVADEEDETKKCFTCTICGATKTEVGGLTSEKIAALQKLTYHTGSMTAAANSRQRPVHFADTIYAAIGIDGLVEKFNSGLTAAGVLSQPFYLTSTGTGYGPYDRTYELRSEENGMLVVDGVVRETVNMLVDGFYGGSWITDADGNCLDGAAAEKSITQLQPGDVILLGENTASFTALLWVAVYQGEIDGQDVFIFGNTYYGSYTNVPATTSYRGKLCFNAQTGVLEDTEFNNSISSTGSTVEVTMDAEIGTFTFNDFLMQDPVSGINWEYFYALRPCKVLGVGQ